MKSRIERIEYLKKLKTTADSEPNRPSYSIKNWRGKTLYAKITEVDADYLMFRIENSRTEIQQLAYLRRHNLPKDFFKDPESPRSQEAQEEILFEMSKANELLSDLEKHEQEDPCIITFDGYIVNGNRRTAALKHLGIRYIDCVILNDDATTRDIYMLEQQLQIAKDFKEDYHWINELRNIRKGIDDPSLNLKQEELAKNLRKDLKDIKIMLRTLDLIDAFLIWKKISGQYDYNKLNDTEEVFRQLEKAVKKYSRDQEKREALQNMVFNLIEHRPKEGRLYGHVMGLIKNFDQVYSKMQMIVPNDQPEMEALKTQKTNLFDELLDGDFGTTSRLFDNPENASETSESLIDVISDVIEENKGKKDAEAVYESVSSALRELQGLTIENDTTKLGGIRNKLEQIISTANRLIEELNSFE